MLRAVAGWVSVLSLMLVMVGVSSDAEAVKLRRPYAENLAFTYGFDNNYGSGSCKDWNCGGICYSGHTGVDHPTPLGTNVLAGEGGKVVAINNTCADYGSYGNTCGGRCGNYVKIQHSDGQTSIYCHMKRNSLVVSNGQNVTCGQKLGQSASSGSSTGPHLHVGWTSSAGTRDIFRGSCTSSPGAWREQRGYREAVGTSCGAPACVPTTEVCDGKDNNCDGKIDEGDVCELDFLTQAPMAYAPPITTDVNGDGLQDACGRFAEGWGCYLATGSGWGKRIQTNLMTDAGGWAHPSHYATIRTGDLDGDGRADVCGRHSTAGYMCWRSTGEGFEAYGNAPGYTNAAGWNKPEYYTTFRLTDINGDGRDDVCARGPAGWSCQLSTGTGFGATVTGPAWSDASGFNRPLYYGTIRTGDINNDGKQDVCIRHSGGFDCYLSTGTKFERFALLPDFSNAGGWSDMKYWSSLRLADYDGDGRADVCARFMSGISCLRSTAAGFEKPVQVVALSDASGWSDPTNYMTIRVGDVNGDGADDFCARANNGMRCYGLKNGAGFSMTGPEWSDASGWDKPQFFQTLMVTDIDQNRRRDICGRAAAGLVCARSTGTGFERIANLAAFTNADKWDDVKYYSTLRLGSGECKPELCNGRDDNCDGKIDEGRPTKMGLTRPKYAARLVEAILPETAVAGSLVEAKVRFLNEGSSAWPVGTMKLEAVANDQTLIDALRPATGWVDSVVAATVSQATAPGATGEWIFPIRVPQNASVFENVLFVLSSPDGAIPCPAPDVTLALGITIEEPEPDDVGGGDGDVGVGNDDAGIGGGDAGADDSGNGNDGSGNGGNADGSDNNGNGGPRVLTSTASCAVVSSATSAGGSAQGAGWALLLMVGGLFWRRRTTKRLAKQRDEMTMKTSSIVTVVLLACSVLGVGCEGTKIVSTTESSDGAAESETLTQREAALLQQESDRAERINMMPSRLLAAYGGWQMEGVLMELLPDSDSPAHFGVKLRHDGVQVKWPFEPLITNAVFVPPLEGEGSMPSVVVRTPGGQLFHVDLKSGQAEQFDEQAGLMISAAQDGCCVSYMVGDMGEQYTLKVATLGGQTAESSRSGIEVQSIDLASNSWAPTISPDGRQVVYVSATDQGNARIYLQEVEGSRKVLVDNAAVFPSGPQPPFWTRDGILFSGEQGGVFLLNTKGEIRSRGTAANSLLIDFRSGQALDMGGELLEFKKN